MGEISREWAARLGLATTPLFGAAGSAQGDPEQHTALLDGVAGSFVLSEDARDQFLDREKGADWSWSSLMRHHVAVQESDVVVTRSDGIMGDRFSRSSVDTKLDDFLRYLEGSNVSRGPDAVDHTIMCFQRLRAELPGTADSQLLGFLGLIALKLRHLDAAVADLPGLLGEMPILLTEYGLDAEPLPERSISPDLARRFFEELFGAHPSGRQLHLDLTIRHAGGELFQAAHLAPPPPPQQGGLFGLSAPQLRVRPHSLKGIAYTPIGLARILAEEALKGVSPNRVEPLTILDPACGSGTFLIEAVAALRRMGWTAPVRLVGYDISSAAIAAAQFAVHFVERDSTDIRIQPDLRVQDFLDPDFTPVVADVVIMNPPYRSWADMSASDRSRIREFLGSSYRGRPDLSMAFVERAVVSAAPQSVIASLLPVGVIASDSAKKWRERISRIAAPRMIGALGEHGLFRFATVNVATLVLDKGSAAGDTVMLWSSEVPGAASASLRELRRRRGTNLMTTPEDTWSIYTVPSTELLARPSWLPAPGLLGPALSRFIARESLRVEDLFNVRLGVRAGHREAFIISADEFSALPVHEKVGFMPVAEKQGIADGRIESSSFLFVGGEDISDEDELRARYPIYSQSFLQPHELALKSRSRTQGRWWQLAEARNTWRNSHDPRIVSRMFVRNNGYAVDESGRYAVVQGFAWFARQLLKSALAEFPRSGDLKQILHLYCIMFSSDIFFKVLREFSTNVAGGQVALQPNLLGSTPVPLLPRLMAIDRGLSDLVDGFGDSSFPTLDERNWFASRCYGLDDETA